MSCPIRFIYDAAMKMPEVETPGGKTVVYQPAEKGKLSGRCWLCGCETETGHPKKKIIKPTFTDHDLAAIPWSEAVCEHCAWALSYYDYTGIPGYDREWIRNSSWCTTDGAERGKIVWLRKYYPELYQRLTKEFPITKNYI